MRSMATGNPFTLSVVLDVTFKNHNKGYALEQTFHSKYKNKRVKGEWFAINPSDILAIKKRCLEDVDFSKIIEGKIRHIVKDLSKKSSDSYWENEYMNELAKFAKRDIKWEYMMLDADKQKDWLRKWGARNQEKEDKLKESQIDLNKKKILFRRLVRNFNIRGKIEEYIDTLPKTINKLTSALESFKSL
jgi:hypothetical protein